MKETIPRAGRRARFATDGFYIHDRPILSADLIRRANEGMDALRRGEYETGTPPQPSYWNPGDSPKKLCKIEMPQLANRAIMEVVGHAELGRLAAEITGARMVQVWWVQLLHKPPVAAAEPSETSVGWHQDRQYWHIWEEGSELFTAWVAISDVREDCGPMRFVRGSHAWGFRDAGDFFGQDLDAQKAEIGAPEGDSWEEVAALLPAGGVSFHHHLTYHGSGPNVSGRPRRSFAIHMRTERSRPVGGERRGLTSFIDDPSRCPVIFGDLSMARG